MQKSLDDTVSRRDLLQTKNEQDQLLLTNAKCEARRIEEEHNAKILILTTTLLQAKQEEERLGGVIQSMEHNHAEEMARSHNDKVELQRQYDLLKEKSACEQGLQESMIQSIEADLVEARQQQERLDDVIRSLELIHAEEMARVRENKADLQCQIDSLTEVLSAEREEHISKIVSLETEVLRALKEVETLEAGVKLLERDQAELIEKSTAEQELLKSKIITLDADLSEAVHDRERLEGIVKSLEHKHAEALARISDDKIDHQHQLHASSSKIQSLETDLLQAVKEVERLENATKLLECKNVEAVAKLDDDNQDLKRQLIELTETSATEQERLRAEHLQSLRAAEGLILESLQYQEELDHAQEEIDTLKEEMLALELIANGRSDEIQCLLKKVEDNQAVTNNMDTQLRKQCGEIVELTKRVDDGRSENEKLTKSLDEEKLQNNVLNQLFADLEDEKDAMVIRIEDLSERLRSTSTTLTDVQQLMIDARQEADEFRSKLESSEALVATLTSQNETTQTKLQSKEDECNNYTKCIADLNTKRNEESQRLLQRCKRQQEASQCEIACLENIVESMKKEFDAFKEEANSASAAQTRLFEDALDSPARDQNRLMEWIHLLEKELVDIRGELESVTEQLHVALEERSSMETTILTLKKEYNLVLEDRSSMENTISVLTKEYELFSLVARHNLEEAQNDNSILEERVRLVHFEATKYKMQNRGMLQALDELTVDIPDDYDDDDYKENATNFTSALTPKSLEIRRTAQMLLSSPKYERAAGKLDGTSDYSPQTSVEQNRRMFFG
jgi:chromosome segregation ATPase